LLAFNRLTKQNHGAFRTNEAKLEARSRHLGLWRDPNPIPPWDFRHGTGAASAEQRMQAGEACPCTGPTMCTGTKGGRYCLTNGGIKSYR
jgi:hypothetical protein